MAAVKFTESVLLFTSLIITLSSVCGIGTAPHDIDCKDAPDGLHEIGCWGYANCVNGQPDVHDCSANLVFDRATMSCVQPGSTQTDCFLPVDCLGKADGSYPDYTDSCVTYYRCYGQKNLGRFYCPAQTAFNEILQICDYPNNLPAPCGPKPAVVTNPPKTTPTTTVPTTQTMKTTTMMPTTTMPTTMMPTTMMPTTTMTTTAMPTTTQNMMTSAQTTQKPMKTSQLHVILTTGSPKPSAQASSTQMPMSTTT